MKTTKNILSINEVDCYIGNSLATKYATDKAVQHQILLNGKHLGRLNKVSDADRYSRIVKEVEVPVKFTDLFEKALEIKSRMKSEFCSSKEEFDLAFKFNKPLEIELNNVIKKMHRIENLDLEYSIYKNIINY